MLTSLYIFYCIITYLSVVYNKQYYYYYHTGVECVGYEDAQLALLLHGSLEGLLDVESLSHDGGVQLALEGQQVHVGLRLGYQVTNLLRQNLVCETLLTLTTAAAVRIATERTKENYLLENY